MLLTGEQGDYIMRLADGICFKSTPAHGYVILTPEKNRAMPDCLRLPSCSYEEDVDWARVALAFPEAFKPNVQESAITTMRNWLPDEYTAFTGIVIPTEESFMLRKRAFWQANADNFIVTCAWGDWHKDVPAGMVGCYAVKGGRCPKGTMATDRPHFYCLVPVAEYEERGEFGFVVGETVVEWGGPTK